MAFDYKKEYKEYYMPKSKPSIVTVPSMNYIAVRGKGNPNEEGGEYKLIFVDGFSPSCSLSRCLWPAQCVLAEMVVQFTFQVIWTIMDSAIMNLPLCFVADK